MILKFVPDNFLVPQVFVSAPFRFEVLEPSVAEIDYEAVMSSREHLRNVFREHDDWPPDDMTLAYNITDLARHQREFNERYAFAYTVRESAGDGYWGCVYINPSSTHFDTQVHLWVSDAALSHDENLYATVRDWLAKDWPFETVAYPGREIPWPDWRKLSN